MTDAQYTAWLKSQAAIRCLLVEVDVLVGASVVTRYLSNKGYVTGNDDTPSNITYSPRIVGGVQFTRKLALDGSVSLSFGDIELTNMDGDLDSWLDDFWANRSIRIYVGDVTWPRSDFRLAYNGVTTGIDTRRRDRINVKLSDKLQRLNTPITENKLGGATSLADSLRPVLLGECHNITPLLVNSAINEYQYHDGPAERVIEVRDNGIPVSFTDLPELGKFRLNQQPYGTITCSAQGARASAQILSTAAWASGTFSSSRMNTPVSGVVAPPYLNAPSYGLVPNTVGGVHYTETSLTGLVAGRVYACSLLVRRGQAQQVALQLFGDGVANLQSVVINFDTGIGSLLTDTGYATNGGVTTGWGAVNLGNGWWRLWIAGYPDGSSTTRRIRIRLTNGSGSASFTADGSTVFANVSGLTFEEGIAPTGYEPSSATYKNTAGDLVRYLCTNYGQESTRFSLTDFDIDKMILFDATHRQPVGVYLSDRQNVLDVAGKLAASVGARLVVDSEGLLSLVKLELPQIQPGTYITGADFVDKTLEISSLAPVVASVKLGYCKNWTVQTTVAAGIVGDGSQLFGEEWLTYTQTDSLAASNYNLYTDPVMEETFLLTVSDASTEANRRLGIFSTQRKVLKYKGLYHLLFEDLGASQTITHPRFGLSEGKIGQIISISADLIDPHVQIEVLI